MTHPIPAIDMWAPFVPMASLLDHAKDHFPHRQDGYLRVFFKQQPDADTFPRLAGAMELTDEAVLAAIDAAHITRTLITGFDEKTSGGTTFVTNDAIAGINERYPGRFIPFAGEDIFRGMPAVRDLEYWVRERGFMGLSLRPFMIGLPPHDRRYYPFYAKCVELDIPVSVHASHNWTTETASDLGHPRHFDVVACEFPELKLILSHAGYPWVLEACLLAWKHPNLYLELAAHRPKYFTMPGAGWEPLLQYGQTTIQDKILYGTGAFLIGRPPAELLAEMRAVPLKPGIMEKWLWRNAAALLGIAPDETSMQ